jgi:type II secretory ATPase GspE/PulE/Tfp pilus assembly ATPase PilB-like protein
VHSDEPTSLGNLFEMGMKLIDERKGGEEENLDLAHEAPIAKLVDSVINQAITEHASDIHIEPEEADLKIRFRIDGLMKEIMAPPKKLESAIISRVKILANLDITETRKPQDGRITVAYKDKDIDFRVSTVRTISGEKIVMRVLDKSGAFVSLDKLGLSSASFKGLQSLISSTSGIIIVCGPTGSGKTSTLYSALSYINTPDKNIITIEDPVEFNLDGINQIPVNSKIGVDFITGLKAILRQDPDIIMVGEVRDYETANIAIQAALTGHLVFTTLHTRNASGAITRLTDMGVQPFLLNSSVLGVLGQRLARSICQNCKEVVNPEIYKSLKQMDLIKEILSKYKDAKFFKGIGCKFCDGSGYKGRVGIFEILALNEDIRELIVSKASSEKIQKVAVEMGMVIMKEDGITKIINGLTTIEEITRILDV